MSLRALLFDLDGTLADTEALGHRPSYNEAFRELGLPFRWSERLYARLLQQSSGRSRLLHYLKRYQPELGPHAESVAESPEAWVEHVHALKTRHFQRLLERGEIPLRPGVARLLREASTAGIKIAVVTNASAGSLRPFLKHGLGQELSRCIETIVGGDIRFARKPAPDLYLHAIHKLGLAPYECVAIEDSQMGLTAARAAGIPAVITQNADTVSHDFLGAALVLNQLGEPGAPTSVVRGHMDEPYLSLKTLRRIAIAAAPRL